MNTRTLIHLNYNLLTSNLVTSGSDVDSYIPTPDTALHKFRKAYLLHCSNTTVKDSYRQVSSNSHVHITDITNHNHLLECDTDPCIKIRKIHNPVT